MPARQITARQLGLDDGLAQGRDDALFKWLIASFLFGKPIQQRVAEQAYRVIVEQHRRDTPRKLGGCSKAELVRMLGQAHYVRYDLSTADRLAKLCDRLENAYAGSVRELHRQSVDRQDFEARLLAFEGIGPKTVEIFMREAGPVLYG
ncbi:DNA methylase [Pseudomonas sp.]|uniref:DNA methylase n=1 Tax=Pseudomonas sp. TaxID=306 RepID=UPI002CE0ABA8|nr:DNA methylase [Pseudomonas sp.]